MSEILEISGDIGPWHALIEEAERHIGIRLNEELESYLVFTLMRYLRRPEMAHRVLALDYLSAFHQHAAQRRESLRDVGDQCLLFSGLFPRRAERRRVRISYYVDLGRGAYRNLAEGVTELASLFGRLAEDFVSAMDILQTVRVMHGQGSGMTALQAWELWEDTEARVARNELGGTPMPANRHRRH